VRDGWTSANDTSSHSALFLPALHTLFLAKSSKIERKTVLKSVLFFAIVASTKTESWYRTYIIVAFSWKCLSLPFCLITWHISSKFSFRAINYWSTRALRSYFLFWLESSLAFNETLCKNSILYDHYISEQTAAEERKMKEEKKRMLLRKLSFRPTVDELKEKKVSKMFINSFSR